MNTSEIANFINEEFKEQKIKRAHVGLSYIRVSDSGKSFAYLKNKTYYYESSKQTYTGKRSLKASITIFKGLINRHHNFECDGILYYFNSNKGEWMWMVRKSPNPFEKK